jgi:hypothetical protein
MKTYEILYLVDGDEVASKTVYVANNAQAIKKAHSPNMIPNEIPGNKYSNTLVEVYDAATGDRVNSQNLK